MAKNKENELLKINREELVNSTYTDSALLNKAIKARAGESHITIKVDSDGKEYAVATYELKNPVGKRTEITTSNMELATRIENVNNSLALGDVAYFNVAKLLENFTETEATELGFDSVDDMCVATFGMAKSTVQNYRRLSRFFVNDDYTLKGAIPKDTPISMLNQLLSYVTINEDGTADISNVEMLFTSSIITPYMKQVEYKARLAKLKSMETDKELSDLSAEELQKVKQDIQDDSAKRKADKANAKKQGKEEKPKATVTVSDNPQVLAGEALNKIKELQEIFKKMNIYEANDFNAILSAVENFMQEQEEQEQEEQEQEQEND